jgi:hypothetical protein
MTDLSLLLVAIFLPVFPLSIGFNALFSRIRQPFIRAVLLLGWPLIGVALYHWLEPQVPRWLVPLALATAVFYGFRLLAMREVGIWTGFIATSIWACLWLPLVYGDREVMLYVVWFGVPLAVLAFLVGGLEKRYGAAYSGLYGGLAQTIPRFSGIFVVTLLAVMATPVFPTFFGMLNVLVASKPAVALTLASLWVLWSWAGMRLIQGMIVGDGSDEVITDTPLALTWGFAALMLVMVVAGFALTGDL